MKNGKVIAWQLRRFGQPTLQFPSNEPAWARNLAKAIGAELVPVNRKGELLQNVGNVRLFNRSGAILEQII